LFTVDKAVDKLSTVVSRGWLVYVLI
jgi:hypothetical protein